MAGPQAAIVSQWNGLDLRGRDTRSLRNELDYPRELVNMVIDERGHLLMPKASSLAHTFPSGQGRIIQMGFIEEPRGILVQMESGRVYHFGLPNAGQWSSANLDVNSIVTELEAPDFFIWTLSSVDKAIFGNASRGAGPNTGETYEVEDSGSGPVATKVTNLPFDGRASYSVLWKGRRFLVYRNRTVWFSALNDHQNFPPDNTFRIGGDDGGGNSWVDNPGFVQGIASWEDNLLFFMNSSVWAMSGGGDPDTWQIRETIATVGTDGGGWTLQSTQYGAFSFGGGNQGDRGVYVFQGGQAKKVSEPVAPLAEGAPDKLLATQQYGYYVLHTKKDSANSIQMLLLDLERQVWTTFDGYRNSAAAVTPHGFFISDDLNLYHVRADRLKPKAFPRKPGRGGKVTLGWADEGHPNGLVRYLGVKISGKKSGGNPTVQVSATIPAGITHTSPAVQLTEDTFDGLLLPLRFRGPGIELELTITPDTDDDEVLIESLELIQSRKGEKVSRH